jgi:hypothetical protein
LLPLLKEAGVPEDHQLKILKDTVKNPLKGKFLGGPSAEEAEKTLREKFKFTDKQIDALKKSASGTEKTASAINYARDIKVNAGELISVLQSPARNPFYEEMAFAHLIGMCAIYSKMILKNPSLTRLLLKAEEMIAQSALEGSTPQMTDEPETIGLVNYLWNWVGGGWNGVWAMSQTEAFEKAKAMGQTTGLKIVPGSLHQAKPGEEERLIAMDR